LISLRDILPEDREAIRQWRNDPEVRRYMYTDHEIGVQEHCAWFARIVHDPTCRYWVISCDGESVGLLYLHDIDIRNKHCYWGFYTSGPSVRGKGVGSFAEFFVLRHVFEELQFHKLCGEVLASNQAVINMHKKFGFVQDGVLRRHILKDGVFEDVVCISILREEWDAKKAELELKLRSKGVL
jgi:UDP-4-amino-4,6-dideoxy-N-acetyl-beta-L-altrosamine N-acetyltransferase